VLYLNDDERFVTYLRKDRRKNGRYALERARETEKERKREREREREREEREN